MFHIVFKVLFTEFCNCACEKKIVMLIRLRHTCVVLLHKKTVLSLETSSGINFEFIKFVKKGQKQIYKYYVPDLGDSRKYYPKECDYHISRDDIFIYHPIRECNMYFIIPNIRSFIFYRLRPTVVRGVPKRK